MFGVSADSLCPSWALIRASWPLSASFESTVIYNYIILYQKPSPAFCSNIGKELPDILFRFIHFGSNFLQVVKQDIVIIFALKYSFLQPHEFLPETLLKAFLVFP